MGDEKGNAKGAREGRGRREENDHGMVEAWTGGDQGLGMKTPKILMMSARSRGLSRNVHVCMQGAQ
jgi:hypothetical protein